MGRKRRIVAAPDRLLLSGSRSILGSPGAEKGIPCAQQHGQHVDEDLIDEPTLQALGCHVRPEDLDILAARGSASRRDRLPRCPRSGT